MSASMNNKYDVGKFAKSLEEFELVDEMNSIDKFLYGRSQEEQVPAAAVELKDQD